MSLLARFSIATATAAARRPIAFTVTRYYTAGAVAPGKSYAC